MNLEKIKEYGICSNCNTSNTGYKWCKKCNAKWFQQNFPNWTSKNDFIDKFIQESQLNDQNTKQVLEWIPYDRFEYVDKGGFSTIYQAIWLDGLINEWSKDEKKWTRSYKKTVALKSLDKSSNLNEEFLNEV